MKATPLLKWVTCCKAELNGGKTFAEEGESFDIMKRVLRLKRRPLLKRASLLT